MANKSYALTSGKVYSGIPTSITNDVTAGIWTPTADAYGNILDASWANLPLNEFVAVAGSQPQAIVDQLTAMGLPPSRISKSVGTLLMTFNAWVGCAVDYVTGRMWVPRGGGHADSSINGCWGYDLESIGGWYVFGKPSDPDLAGFEWDEGYSESGFYTTYPVAGADLFRRTTLPDGKPTSAHTYAGVWFNPVARAIQTSRSCLWSYSADNYGKNPSQAYVRINGVESSISINNWQFFDYTDNKVKGYVPIGANGTHVYYTMDADSTIFTAMPSSSYQTRSMCFHGGKFYSFGNSSAFRLMDVATQTWEGAAQATTWQSTSQADQEMVACVFIPQTGKILRRFGTGGRWIMFNPATLVNEDWTPAGNVPPTTLAPANKYFYYPRRKCLVVIAAHNFNQPSVYLMRLE
jgi:hypothetical protein